MRSLLTIAVLTLWMAAMAKAQLTADLERLTCSEFMALSPEAKLTTSAWLDGYRSATAQNMRVDFQRSATLINDLSEKCRNMPTAAVGPLYRQSVSIAHFGCDASPNDRCHFAIYPSSAAPPKARFTIGGGSQRYIQP